MNAIHTALVAVQTRIVHIFTVDNPTPDFSGPGVSALQSVANVVFAIVLICALIGGLISGGAIAVGHVSSNGTVQKRGIIGVIACIAGVAVAGSIAGLVNWGQSLHVA
jgi:cag pathogenicity island protein 25